MLRVLGPLARALRLLVREERLVLLSRTRGVSLFRETLRAEHQSIQVRGDRRENGVGFGERGVRIVSSEVQYAQVVVCVKIERRQLRIGPQGHGHEELYGVLHAALS